MVSIDTKTMERKNRNLKQLRQQMKDQEKWRDEAISLLTKQGIEDPTTHSSVIKFTTKIEALKEEVANFHQDSEATSTEVVEAVVSKPTVSTPQYKEPDRWADTKAENVMKREWNWLCRMDGFVPSYMRENLAKMPNNKGYIWKGIYYFGDLPPEHPMDVTTMFEKQNQILFIHEWTPEYYKIFEKGDKQKPKILKFENYF